MKKYFSLFKVFILVIILLGNSEWTNAQTRDELRANLKTDQRFDARLKTYTQLSESYLSSNMDSSFLWMDKAIKKIGDKKWPPFYTKAMMRLILTVDRQADFTNMIKYTSYFCSHYQQHKNTKDRNLALSLKAYAMGMTGDFDKSMVYFQETKGYLETQKFKDDTQRADRLAQYYSSIGIVHAVHDEPSAALKYFLAGDSVLQYGGSKDVKQESQYCIGSIYSQLGELEKSNAIFLQLIKEHNDGQEISSIFAIYDNLASNYMQLDDFENARKYVQISIEKGGESEDIDQLGYSYLQLGTLLSEEGKHLEAKKAFQKASENFLKARNTLQHNSTRLMYAESCNNSNTDLNEALSITSELIVYFAGRDVLQKKADCYKIRSTTLRKLKRYDEAFEAYDVYDSLSQEYIRSINDKETAELKTKYETDLHKRESAKQTKIAHQQSKIAQYNKLDSQRKSMLLWVIGGASIFLLLILVFLFNFNRRLQQSRALLNEQKIRIEKSEKEKSTLLKELHHRVKNNLQIVSSLLNLQKENVKDEVAKGAFTEGQNRVEAMAMIHRYLYSTDELTDIELGKYFTQLVQSIAYSYGYDQKKVAIEFDVTEANIDVDIAIPLGLVANELVSNVFKHAIKETENPSLYVGLHSNEELVLEINDNGAGIPGGLKENKSSSFGMSLINSLAKQMKARLEYSYDNGSKIRMIIPKSSLLNQK